VPPHGLLGGGLILLLDFMGKMDREGRVHD
ncbi:hypothetical protein ACSLGU_32585, partial [Acinetobacter sp. A11]